MQSSGDNLRPDAVVMERWEDYRGQVKRDFLQGFDDGLHGGLPHSPKMSEAYSQGYNNGYALARMQDKRAEVSDVL